MYAKNNNWDVIKLEWKWIKNFLILIFILLNCFLGYKVYLKNQDIHISNEIINTVNVILSERKVTCEVNLAEINVNTYMKKIRIESEEIIEPQFIYQESIKESKNIYIGRNREVLSLPVIITNFLRDTKIENTLISNIVLGYYPEMSQIDKNVLSGEATPAWLIVLANGEEYIYNAYLGERMAA